MFRKHFILAHISHTSSKFMLLPPWDNLSGCSFSFLLISGSRAWMKWRRKERRQKDRVEKRSRNTAEEKLYDDDKVWLLHLLLLLLTVALFSGPSSDVAAEKTFPDIFPMLFMQSLCRVIWDCFLNWMEEWTLSFSTTNKWIFSHTRLSRTLAECCNKVYHTVSLFLSSHVVN